MNVTITQANGGYIISTPNNGLFVATNLNAAVRIAKEQFAATPEAAE